MQIVLKLIPGGHMTLHLGWSSSVIHMWVIREQWFRGYQRHDLTWGKINLYANVTIVKWILYCCTHLIFLWCIADPTANDGITQMWSHTPKIWFLANNSIAKLCLNQQLVNVFMYKNRSSLLCYYVFLFLLSLMEIHWGLGEADATVLMLWHKSGFGLMRKEELLLHGNQTCLPLSSQSYSLVPTPAVFIICLPCPQRYVESKNQTLRSIIVCANGRWQVH